MRLRWTEQNHGAVPGRSVRSQFERTRLDEEFGNDMKLDIDVSLTYRLGSQRLALLALQAARFEGQSILREQLSIADADLSVVAGEWGVGQRSWIRTDTDRLQVHYAAQVTVSREPALLPGRAEAPLPNLGGDQLTFLRPSRYCQSDLLESFAADRFGHLTGGEKITAILDWIADEMTYDPGHSTSATTVLQTLEARKGVCRDYAHLLCGLARASHIPARYVSAYGLSVEPPDFHAVVEVWLDNAWHMVDPSGMCAADEIVVIGVGRDAADVPFMETPDEAAFVDQHVRVTAG